MKRNYDNRNRQHSTASNTSETSAASATTNNYEIPGFYYDEEKKRYFKIQPNHQRIANVVTHDTVKHKIHEESVVKSVKKTRNNSFLKNILLNFEVGVSNRRSLYNECNNYVISNLKYKSRVDISDIQNQIDDICAFKLNTDNQNDYVYLLINSLLPINEYLLKFVKLNKYSDKFTSHVSNVEIDRIDFHQCSNRRAYVQDNEYLAKSYIGTALDGTVYYIFDVNKLSIKSDDETENTLCQSSIFKMRFADEFRTSALNSCSRHDRYLTKLSLGFVDHASIVTVQAVSSNRHTEVNTLESQVFCQRFHPIDNETLIYNGCKKFYILGHDLRKNTKNHNSQIMKLDHKSSVIDFVFSKKDPNYLFSTDFSGQIYQWDARSTRTVCTYNGNFNENSHRKLSLTECEDYIYTVGQDGHTRVFSTKSSDLIKTILTPNPIRGHNLYAEIPSVYISDNLNLFYAINKCIKLYSL